MRGRKNIEDTVDMVVVALCADFRRRAEAIRQGSVTHRTEMEYTEPKRQIRHKNLPMTIAKTTTSIGRQTKSSKNSTSKL